MAGASARRRGTSCALPMRSTCAEVVSSDAKPGSVRTSDTLGPAAIDELGVGRRGIAAWHGSRDAGEVNHRPRTRCSTECPNCGHSPYAGGDARRPSKVQGPSLRTPKDDVATRQDEVAIRDHVQSSDKIAPQGIVPTSILPSPELRGMAGSDADLASTATGPRSRNWPGRRDCGGAGRVAVASTAGRKAARRVSAARTPYPPRCWMISVAIPGVS